MAVCWAMFVKYQVKTSHYLLLRLFCSSTCKQTRILTPATDRDSKSSPGTVEGKAGNGASRRVSSKYSVVPKVQSCTYCRMKHFNNTSVKCLGVHTIVTYCLGQAQCGCLQSVTGRDFTSSCIFHRDAVVNDKKDHFAEQSPDLEAAVDLDSDADDEKIRPALEVVSPSTPPPMYVEMVPGKGPPPEPPVDCCMSGCANCVWIQYAEELRQYFSQGEGNARAKKAIEQIDNPGLQMFLKMELGLL